MLPANSQNKGSDVIELSKFNFKDSSLPSLRPGLYLINQPGVKSGVSKKLYSYFSFDTATIKQVYNLSTNGFLDFKNVDSIYATKEDTPYQKYYEITLKLNAEGQKQFFNLTSNPKYYIQDVWDKGLLIGTVINNTLVNIVHVYEAINADKISIAGGIADEENVHEIMKYLKKASTEK